MWAPCMPTAGRSRRRCWRCRCRNTPRRGSKVGRPSCAPWGRTCQTLGTTGSGTKYHATKGSKSGKNDALRARGAVRLADRRVQRGCHGSGPKRDHEPRTEKPARVIHGRLMVHEATAPKNRPYRDERAASDELFTLAERGPRCRSQTATASATSTSFPQVTAMVTVAQWMEPSAVTSLTASRRGKSVLSAAPPANKVAAITAADVPHRRPIQLLWLKVRRAASLHKSPAYWPALVQPVRLLRPLASAASRELIGPKLRSPSP